MRVLVVNAGSSSLKLRLLDRDDTVVATEDLSASLGWGETIAAVKRVLAEAPPVDAVGHRVVHGGPEFVEAVLVDADVERRLDRLTDLAPLHNPASLSALRVTRTVLPDVPAVACFDTAFFAGLPAAAATYALPRAWIDRWKLRRYGFHGLSHAYVSRRAAAVLGKPPAELRLVTAHLGAGASLAAVAGGRPVDTTMGFTPLDGLVMATRSGSVDPGLLLSLLRHESVTLHQLDHGLEKESGLAGLSGVSGDLRQVLAAATRGHLRAQQALAVYLHRLCGLTASMTAAMEGIDGLVFTGGVGENSPWVRAKACRRLQFLGVGCDETANAGHQGGEAVLSATGAPVAVLVVPAREDIEVAGEVRALLAPAAAAGE